MLANEAELVRAAVGGDAGALSTLLEHYGPQIERQLRIDPAWQAVLEPGDVMQVTYLESFLRIGHFDPAGGSFSGWLRQIAENNLRDAIRELARQKRPQPAQRVEVRAPEDSVVVLLDALGVTSTTPSRLAARDEMLSALTRALEALPEDYASAVRLYDLECRPIADVARALGRSPGAVHMLRSRAHDRLRELMSGSGGLGTTL